jgi:hypothetical protein
MEGLTMGEDAAGGMMRRGLLGAALGAALAPQAAHAPAPAAGAILAPRPAPRSYPPGRVVVVIGGVKVGLADPCGDIFLTA